MANSSRQLQHCWRASVFINLGDLFDYNDWVAQASLRNHEGGHTQIASCEISVNDIMIVKSAIEQKAYDALLLNAKYFMLYMNASFSRVPGVTKDASVSILAFVYCRGQNNLENIVKKLCDECVHTNDRWHKLR